MATSYDKSIEKMEAALAKKKEQRVKRAEAKIDNLQKRQNAKNKAVKILRAEAEALGKEICEIAASIAGTEHAAVEKGEPSDNKKTEQKSSKQK